MRASWKVNRSYGESGPFVIQLAISGLPLLGIHYRPPLPDHQHFQTRKSAEIVRRALSRPFVTHGVVVDGIKCTGIAYTRRLR
jgi:hypothetical protein